MLKSVDLPKGGLARHEDRRLVDAQRQPERRALGSMTLDLLMMESNDGAKIQPSHQDPHSCALYLRFGKGRASGISQK